MRRLVVIATALAVLVAAASAFAATGGLNTYTATVKFSPNKAGTSKAPSAIGFTENYVAGGTNGNRTAPLTDIKTTVYGAVSNGKSFPTCSFGKISGAKSDAGCPKGALIATGSITAILGPVLDPSASDPNQIPCDPLLHVWNAGQGKVVYFFDETSTHTCGPIQTGDVSPFAGTAKTVGKNLVLNTPIPNGVSFPITGVEGSLTSLTLHYLKLTKAVKGKAAIYQASTACKSGKRPYSVAFTAESAPGATPVTQTVTGTQKCS
ncbi:MAG TPA: hypothetical protein VMF57_18055 [Solirubrobacteraceae bacterium]|nr:hypothetical protein [Solirubrobacteraceae bacterium]